MRTKHTFLLIGIALGIRGGSMIRNRTGITDFSRNHEATTLHVQDWTSSIQNELEELFPKRKPIRDYTQLIPLLSGTDSKTAYALGIIYMGQAYDVATDTPSYEQIQEAKKLISQAQNNIDTASHDYRLQASSKEKLSLLQDFLQLLSIQECMILPDTQRQSIQANIQSLQEADKLITQEQESITTSSADVSCQEDRLSELETYQTNIQKIQSALTQKLFHLPTKTYEACSQYTGDQSIPALQTLLSNIRHFLEELTSNIQLRKTNQTDIVSQLCSSVPTPSTSIDQSIQDTLQSLGIAITENNLPASASVHFRDLGTDTQKLLESSQQNNKKRIRQLLRMRADPNYSSTGELSKLFKTFYGNIDDFTY